MTFVVAKMPTEILARKDYALRQRGMRLPSSRNTGGKDRSMGRRNYHVYTEREEVARATRAKRASRSAWLLLCVIAPLQLSCHEEDTDADPSATSPEAEIDEPSGPLDSDESSPQSDAMSPAGEGDAAPSLAEPAAEEGEQGAADTPDEATDQSAPAHADVSGEEAANEQVSAPSEEIGGVAQAVVNGPLTFAAAIDAAGGSTGATALDAQDLDGDGLIDVGVFRGSPRRFSWYQSPKTPGSAWTKRPFPQPAIWRGFIGAAKFADIDRDGDYDLVVTMDDSTPSAYIYWLENPRPAQTAQTGTWTIRTIRANLPVRHINDLEVADMDGDGKLDVIFRALQPTNELHVYFQDSKTAWTGKVISAVPYGPTGEGFAVGNIDRSGHPDITICGHWLRAPASPRTQSYTAFGIDVGYKTVNQNTKEDVGDIDGDGDLDVVISPAEGYRGGRNHVLAWYRNPGNPSSVPAWTRTILASNMNGGHTVKLADMDRDGDLDVVSGVTWNLWGQTKSVKVYFNSDRGKFGIVQTVAAGRGLYSGVARDIGNDGKLDIIGQDGYAGSALSYVYPQK